MLFPNHHSIFSFLSLSFRVSVCGHLTYPIYPLHSLALAIHDILAPWPATYLPRRRVPTFEIRPNTSLVSLELAIATHSAPRARNKARGPI